MTLPLMKPRRYSISSASEVQPRQISLTVGVLKVNIRKGEKWLYAPDWSVHKPTIQRPKVHPVILQYK